MTAEITHSQPSLGKTDSAAKGVETHGTVSMEEYETSQDVTGPVPTWVRVRAFLREPFSEFFGVMILVLFGDGSVAQVVLGGGTKGDWQSINWGWA